MFVRAVSICLIPEYGILARAVLYGYSKKILSVNYEKACFALTMVFFRKVMGVCKKKVQP